MLNWPSHFLFPVRSTLLVAWWRPRELTHILDIWSLSSVFCINHHSIVCILLANYKNINDEQIESYKDVISVSDIQSLLIQRASRMLRIVIILVMLPLQYCKYFHLLNSDVGPSRGSIRPPERVEQEVFILLFCIVCLFCLLSSHCKLYPKPFVPCSWQGSLFIVCSVWLSLSKLALDNNCLVYIYRISEKLFFAIVCPASKIPILS